MKIEITSEDVDIIREALALSQMNYNTLYENNGDEFSKAHIDKIVYVISIFTKIANRSSSTIEVSK